MRKLSILLSILLFSTYAFSQIGKVSGGKVYDIPNWFSDSFLDIAEDAIDATENDKSLLLYFHLDGCPYCDAMLSENFKSGPNLDFIKDNFVVIAVNIKGDREITMLDDDAKTEKQLSSELKVQYTPAILFLDKNAKIIFRTNGYRKPQAFRQVLEYVASKSYKNINLSTYIENQKTTNQYSFIPNSSLQKITYFKDYNQPVAILFESKDCLDCTDFHNKLLARTDVQKELDKFLFVRFDSYSDEKIIDFDGITTSPKQMLKDYKLNYQPGILLFDEGEYVNKIDGKLYSFHFNTALEHVSGKHYQDYPQLTGYMRKKQEELLSQGVDINIVDP